MSPDDRTSQVAAALSLVCERALALESVSRFALVAVDFSKEAIAVAGGELTPDEVKEAAWAYESRRSVGVRSCM